MNTLFLIGSGALRDAWTPVIRALQAAEFPDVQTSEAANFALSRLVYNLRIQWHLEADAAQKKDLLDKYNNIRRTIAKNLVDAETRGELQVQEEFEHVAMTFVLTVEGTVSMATTNWDGAVATAMQKIAARYHRSLTVKQIHGTSQDPKTLYLPSEMVGERYRDIDEDNKMGGIHLGLLQAVERADRIVVYGLSLSPLDVELGEMINAGLEQRKLREVCIIDPWYTGIAERMQVLVDSSRGKSIPIRCFHPAHVDHEWTYDPEQRSSESERLKVVNSST